MPENLWVTQSGLKLIAEHSIPDADSDDTHLVEVVNLILHHQERKFRMKQKEIMEETWFRHEEG